MVGLVGREPEIAVIESFLAADEAGFAALELVGEAGIGKTTVWQAAVRRGDELGLPVLSARPAESESRLSFAGLTDLLAAVDADVLGTLPTPQAEALDVALLRAGASRSPGRRLVGTALLSVLRELTSKGPVLVAVDDAQWLDPPSASVLEFALRRLDDRPVRLVASRRADASRPEFVGTRARRLELGPLSVAALQRIVSERLGVTFSRPTLVRLAEASRGNAFFALEIARLLARGDMQPTAGRLPVPDDLRSLAEDRISSLPTATRDTLLRAAALAHPDSTAVDVGALAPAEEAGLVSDRRGRRDHVHASAFRVGRLQVGVGTCQGRCAPCPCRRCRRPRATRSSSGARVDGPRRHDGPRARVGRPGRTCSGRTRCGCGACGAGAAAHARGEPLIRELAT